MCGWAEKEMRTGERAGVRGRGRTGREVDKEVTKAQLVQSYNS